MRQQRGLLGAQADAGRRRAGDKDIPVHKLQLLLEGVLKQVNRATRLQTNITIIFSKHFNRPKESQMFKSSAKAEVLKQIVDVISTLVDEAKFNVDADGISLKAVDPAHVAMVEMSLGKQAFEEFAGEDTELGIDLEKLREILKLAHSGDIVKMEHNEDKNQLIVKIGDVTRRMSLVDTAGMSDPKVPNIDLPTTIKLKAEELNYGIRASESVSDHIALVADDDYFEMSSEGDSDSVDFRLPKEKLITLESKGKVRSLFPLDYFSNMAKAISGGSEVKINLGNNYPVKLEFEIAGGNGHVKYLLAPRVES
jgi:proliferating cell nuclear antigen